MRITHNRTGQLRQAQPEEDWELSKRCNRACPMEYFDQDWTPVSYRRPRRGPRRRLEEELINGRREIPRRNTNNEWTRREISRRNTNNQWTRQNYKQDRYTQPQNVSTFQRPRGRLTYAQVVQRTQRKPPKTNNYIKPDETFSKMLRSTYKIIKMIHHSNNVSRTTEPPNIKRLVDYLTKIIAPAYPTQKTKKLLEGNAKNWSFATRAALEDHYQSGIEEAMEELSSTMDDRWPQAFTVAKKWALKNLGSRLKEESLTQAEDMVSVVFQTFVEEKEAESQNATPTTTQNTNKSPQQENTPKLNTPHLHTTPNEDDFPPLVKQPEQITQNTQPENLNKDAEPTTTSTKKVNESADKISAPSTEKTGPITDQILVIDSVQDSPSTLRLNRVNETPKVVSPTNKRKTPKRITRFTKITRSPMGHAGYGLRR